MMTNCTLSKNLLSFTDNLIDSKKNYRILYSHIDRSGLMVEKTTSSLTAKNQLDILIVSLLLSLLLLQKKLQSKLM